MKPIAFYLPQFHEFEVNNRCWGKGFTEWTCLNRVHTPLCDGHVIRRPHKDIGQYCLLDSGTRKRQGEMARDYGLFGFCYYHYWFHDKALMDAPLRLMLEDGHPDLPFCFSWANEPWTRKMNGGTGEVIVPQSYGDREEWQQHLDYLLSFFHHPNYICIDGKPLLVVYRASAIKQLTARLEFWRDAVRKEGFEGMFLVATLGNFLQDPWSRFIGSFDATVESFPNFFGNPRVVSHRIDNANFYEMDMVTQYMIDFPKVCPVRQIPGLLTGFDSFPRSPRVCNVVLRATPQRFRQALRRKMAVSSDEFIFINAWNEWGEGATLEPDEVYGYGFLESLSVLRDKVFL